MGYPDRVGKDQNGMLRKLSNLVYQPVSPRGLATSGRGPWSVESDPKDFDSYTYNPGLRQGSDISGPFDTWDIACRSFIECNWRILITCDILWILFEKKNTV